MLIDIKSKSDDNEYSEENDNSVESEDSVSDPDEQSHLLAGDYRPSSDGSSRKQVEVVTHKKENQFISTRQFAKTVDTV